MSRARSGLFPVFFAILAFALSAVAADPAAELAAYADHLLAETYPASEPGAAALVLLDGKVVLRKGYGMANLELGVPVQPDMVFEVGSVTKQFTAAAILLLAERGLLSLDDDVTKHLTDYPAPAQKVTIEHLLTHTSGIPSYTGLPEWMPRVREDMKVQQILDMFKDKPLEFTPGEKFAYNNSGYILLGAVIEKVSGKSYEEFVEQEIFKPLGMTHSYYGSNQEVIPGRIDGYQMGNEGYRRAPYLSMSQPYAAGSLISTVDDLARWDEALRTGKLLKPASLERMYSPYKLASGASTDYAFGWMIDELGGKRIIEHGGGIFGFSADVVRVPEVGLVVVILSNNGSKDTAAPAYRIAAKALGHALEDRPVLSLSEKALDEYVAVYRFDPQTTRTVTREGAKLYSQRSGGAKVEIVPTAADEFFVKESESRLRFRRDEQGKIAGADLVPRFGPDEKGVRTEEAPAAERQAVKVDPALFDAYAGVYELMPGFELTISREGDQIFGQATGQPKVELFPESESKFFLKVVDAQVEFVRGADGKAESLVLHQGGRDTPAKRIK